MPTITIAPASIEFVPADNGGIYINALKGRSIKATIKLEDGTTREVSLRTVVIHAPSNANTALAAPDRAHKKEQSAAVDTLTAKVDTLASQFGQLLAALTPTVPAKRGAK